MTQASASDAALVVDLDGTLVHTDLLIESAFVLARERPRSLLKMPAWLCAGKATLKHEIASRAALDVGRLPYNRAFIAYLETEHAAGRRIVLATAADRRYAEAVAAHLSLFEAVLASDETTNLSGERKLAAIRAYLGDDTPFEYAADHSDDRVIWASAQGTLLVGADNGTRDWAERNVHVTESFDRPHRGIATWLRAMRLYQWAKNILIFVPLMATHSLVGIDTLAAACMAFLAYGLLASSVYLLNDLVDLSDDRQHPNKRFRPLASGALPLLHGIIAIPVLMATAALIALFLPPLFGAVLGMYYVLTLAYSMVLKRVALIDVVTLAALYTLRLIAGGVATGIHLSFWLLALSMSMFLSLAMAKRCTELLLVRSGHTASLGRGYREADIETLKTLGTAAGYAAVVILALYINSPDITEQYDHPARVWLLCPVVLYWISRIWLMTMRGRMTDDPIVFAARDRASQICILLGGLIMIAAL
ncbi:UbiA family prenyltransferase [Salinisphaera sp. Q1T1-3]|uniref:UbiA family prenyltransferase n=1 Tax=Salinisphaera sp. Q1T1-3 TaxID=2321229 RepID=UPI000E70AC1A|nr:UbiA family prenyltransferase [Salinisphaera sp. Q1T1-3]RJS92352.1 UbiA family prenyltransferase [Salinisphaera sp. Q1T1-3]